MTAADAPSWPHLAHLWPGEQSGRVAARDWDGAFRHFQMIHNDGLGRLGLHQLRADLGFRLAEHLCDSPANAAVCLRSGALGYVRLGRYDDAREQVERAEALAHEATDWLQIYRCLNIYGTIAFNERRLEEACKQYQESLECVDKYGLSAYNRAVGTANIAECLYYIGDFEGAAKRADAVIGIFEQDVRSWERSNLKLLSGTWRYRAQIHLARDNREAAKYCVDVAVALARGSNNLWHLGVTGRPRAASMAMSAA